MRHLLAQCRPLEGEVTECARQALSLSCVNLIHNFRVSASIGHYYCPIEDRRKDKISKVEVGEIDKGNFSIKTYAGFSNQSVFEN